MTEQKTYMAGQKVGAGKYVCIDWGKELTLDKSEQDPQEMSGMCMRRVPVLPHDAYPPGCQDSRRMPGTHPNVVKVISNHLIFFLCRSPRHSIDSWELLEKNPGRVPAPSLYPGKQKEGLHMVNVSKKGQVFRCEICGNIVVVKEAAAVNSSAAANQCN